MSVSVSVSNTKVVDNYRTPACHSGMGYNAVRSESAKGIRCRPRIAFFVASTLQQREKE